MGACCNARDRGLKDTLGNSNPPKTSASLHVLNSKQDYRLSRILKLMLETRGKLLLVKETLPTELPETSLKYHPILEYDNKVLSGEFAIAQYVAYRENFYPADLDPIQLYYVESMIAEVKDLWEVVAEGREEGLSTLIPALERRLGADGVHFVGQNTTLADIYVYDFLRKCVSSAFHPLPDRLLTFVHKFETSFKVFVQPL